jgi:hypothetical protein
MSGQTPAKNSRLQPPRTRTIYGKGKTYEH